MRKHPLLVLSTLLLMLSALGLLGPGVFGSHKSPTSLSRNLAPRVVLARAVRRGAPLPFLVSLTRAARRTALLARHPIRVRAVVRPQSAPTTNPTWVALRDCESGGNYATNTGNGYYGAYQFAATTWWGLGLPGLASAAPPAVQDHAAQLLESRVGWGAWPVCSVLLGLR